MRMLLWVTRKSNAIACAVGAVAARHAYNRAVRIGHRVKGIN